MECKHKIPWIFKTAVVLVFSLLLIYWALEAIHKFNKQPIATYVTYTQGDDNNQIVPPHITVCPKNFVTEDKFLSKCSDGSTTFLDALKKCLNHTDFDPDEYLEYLMNKSTKGIITSVNTIWTAALGILDLFHVDLTFSKFFGPCATFDPTPMIWNFRSHSQVSLILNQSTASLYYVKLHTEYDGPDSCWIHHCFDVQKNTLTWLGLKKKYISRESTQKIPCHRFNKYTCQEIEQNEQIAIEFGCKLPFLYSGTHLNQYLDEYANIPLCRNRSTLIQALHLPKTAAGKSCQDYVACERIKFDIIDKKEELLPNKTIIGLKFEEIEVEHFTSYISYDSQSLISELGGVLGMFLGLSGVSLGFSFIDFLCRHIINCSQGSFKDEKKCITKKKRNRKLDKLGAFFSAR